MARLLKYTGIVFVLMALARSSGFIRNILLVNTLDVGTASDAFFISIAIVDFIILMSGLNAMKSVSTTTFTQEQGNNADIRTYLSSLMYAVVAYGLVLSIPLFAAPRVFVRLFAPGLDAEAVRITSVCVRICAVLVLCKGLLPVFESLLGVQRKFVAQNIFMPVINAATIAVILVTPPQSLLYRFCQAFVLSFALACVAGYFFVAGKDARLVRVSYPVIKRNVSRFARLAFPLLFATCAYSIAGIADKIIASFFKSGVITSLGIAYNLCFMTIGILLDPIWKVLFPHFSKLYFDKEHDKLRGLFNNGQTAVVLIFVPVSMFFMLFSSDVIGAVFCAKKISPEHVEAAARILSIYGAALIFNAGFFLPSYLLQSAQKNSYVGKAAAIAFSGNIVCSIVFSLLWGYIGIPLGTLAAMCAYVILLLFGIKKHVGISLNAKLFVPAAGAIAISLLAALAASRVQLPQAWFSSLPVYAYPIAGFLGKFVVFFSVAAGAVLVLFRNQLRWLIRK